MNKKDKIKKIIYLSILIILCIFITIFILLPFIKLLMTEEGRVTIQSHVKSFGIFAPILFILMEITHIVLAFIPGGPVEIISGVLFGAIWGLVLCEIGIFIATIIIYHLVKKIGNPIVATFISEDKIKKFKFLHNEKKLELIVFIIMIIPGTPKDAILYITALTNINPTKFYFIATISRIPTVASSTLMGATLSKGKIELSIIIFLITAAIGFTGIFFSNHISEKKNK